MNKGIALLLVVAITGCAQAQQPSADDAAPTLDGWVAAHNRGDLDALVQTYAPNVTLLPPDGSIARGSDAVRATFADIVASEGVRIERVAAWHDTNLAAESGTWEHFTRDTHATTSAGTYTVVWQRDDAGAWRIVNNSWTVRPSAAATQEATR